MSFDVVHELASSVIADAKHEPLMRTIVHEPAGTWTDIVVQLKRFGERTTSTAAGCSSEATVQPSPQFALADAAR